MDKLGDRNLLGDIGTRFRKVVSSIKDSLEHCLNAWADFLGDEGEVKTLYFQGQRVQVIEPIEGYYCLLNPDGTTGKEIPRHLIPRSWRIDSH